MIHGQYYLPIWYDLLATFAFAITGAMVGLRKHYDIVGVTALALAVGVGGGIIRDGVFLQKTPAIATDWRYMAAIFVAVGVALILKHRLEYRKASLAIDLLDALGLAAYTIVGTQKAIFGSLIIVGAILVGVINAVGGGILRDVLSGEEPHIFRPSQLYALISICGSILFLVLAGYFNIGAQQAALIAMSVMFGARVIAILFDVKTVPAKDLVKPIKKPSKSSK
jgi:uncharacterized membrane protein YeiH